MLFIDLLGFIGLVFFSVKGVTVTFEKMTSREVSCEVQCVESSDLSTKGV